MMRKGTETKLNNQRLKTNNQQGCYWIEAICSAITYLGSTKKICAISDQGWNMSMLPILVEGQYIFATSMVYFVYYLVLHMVLS